MHCEQSLKCLVALKESAAKYAIEDAAVTAIFDGDSVNASKLHASPMRKVKMLSWDQSLEQITHIFKQLKDVT